MGPLVPFILSNEFSLVIALLIGIGFGIVLEQAGFSSTKKLVGLFYGYDFTVLKVFFTAGVTAMIGVLVLAHVGMLDLKLIYINPTFLWSALLGGAIMGLGFVIGGFCPGTSICAAAIGKLDAMAFVIGACLGVFIFAEGYPIWDTIYLGEDWGPALMNEKLGMSKILFAILLSTVAFVAFYVTGKIEDKVNGKVQVIPTFLRKRYIAGIAVAFGMILFLIVMPDSQILSERRIEKAFHAKSTTYNRVSVDKLAFEIVNHHSTMNLIDVRSAEEFKKYHLPLAINIPYETLDDRQLVSVLTQKHKANYFYSDRIDQAQKAYLLATFSGKAENYLLDGTIADFQRLYENPQQPSGKETKQLMTEYLFRSQAADEMKNLVKIFGKSNEAVKPKASKIKGGCS